MLAGRTSIPKEIPEAAAIDGAGFWRTEFLINIPMMMPIISVAVLFGTIFTFTDMTVVYILTAGGPFDSTQVLPRSRSQPEFRAAIWLQARRFPYFSFPFSF